MKVICSWCIGEGKTLDEAVIVPEDGTGGLDSHGICPVCKDKYYPSKPKPLSETLEVA